MNIQKGCSADLQVAQNCKGMAIVLKMTEVREKKGFMTWAGIDEVKLNRDKHEDDFESAEWGETWFGSTCYEKFS